MSTNSSTGARPLRRGADMQLGNIIRLVVFNTLAAVVGLSIGLFVVLATGADVGKALTTLIFSPISDTYNMAEVFVWFTALLTISLGIGFALRANLWNVGAEGQFLIGSITCMISWKALQDLAIIPPLHMLIMLAAGALGGLAWIVIPALLKAKFGTNEIVVTLLLNIVAVSMLFWALDGPIRGRFSAGYLISDVIPRSLRLPQLIPETRLSVSIFIALALVVLMYFLSERTHFGLSVKAVGKNPEAARYSGINIPMLTIKTMFISGALAGLAGAMHVMGVLYRMDAGYAETGFGYIAIVVAMLGAAHPFGILLASLFFSYIMIGAQAMQRAVQIPFPLVLAVVGIILISLTISQYLMRVGIFQLKPSFKK